MMLQLMELITVTPSDWLGDTAIHWQVSQLVQAAGFDHGTLFAQNAAAIQSVDIMADFQKAWTNFIQSGQVWALGIGLVLGWILHSFIGS